MKYTDFCKSIDTVFTIKGIEKNPNLRVKPVQSQDTLKARQKFLDLDENDKQIIQDILSGYREEIINKRLDLKPSFRGFDRTQCGHVTSVSKDCLMSSTIDTIRTRSQPERALS